jgi:hypothetical protein
MLQHEQNVARIELIHLNIIVLVAIQAMNKCPTASSETPVKHFAITNDFPDYIS